MSGESLSGRELVRLLVDAGLIHSPRTAPEWAVEKAAQALYEHLAVPADLENLRPLRGA